MPDGPIGPAVPSGPRPAARDNDLLATQFEPSQASVLPEGARPASPPTEQPKVLETLTVALAWASSSLSLLAVLGAAVPAARTASLGIALAALLTGLAALGCSLGIGTLRHLRAEITGGTVYDQMRGMRTLRIASLLLQFLISGALVLVVLRLLGRAGLGPDLAVPFVERALLVLIAALGVGAGLAHLQSLRTPTYRDRSGPTWTVFGITVGFAIVVGAIAALALAGTEPAIGGLTWGKQDVAILTTAAFASMALALRRSRGLPSTASMMADTPSGGTGPLQVNRTKAVLVPTILAFALLLVVFLLILLFGIGIGDLITTVGSNPLILGALVFLIVALVGSLGLAMLLSRSAERDVPLYARLPDRKVRQVRWILAVSGVVATVLAIGAFLSFTGAIDSELGLHLACFALMVALGPYGFYISREWVRIRKLEERFPDFLRDIASSHKGGLTLHQSVTIAARGEYGPLTPEVRKMADQLSWNVSFHEALERFAQRVETPLVQRAVNLILQADKSGGSTTDVLLAAARDAREIKNLETERRQTMSLYTIVVYITFFVFLGVAAVLYGQFAPAIVESSQAVQGSQVSTVGTGVAETSLSLRDYQVFYFVAAIVQAVGDGVVAGLLGQGRASLGLRHSFLMVLATYVTFILLL